ALGPVRPDRATEVVRPGLEPGVVAEVLTVLADVRVEEVPRYALADGGEPAGRRRERPAGGGLRPVCPCHTGDGDRVDLEARHVGRPGVPLDGPVGDIPEPDRV